MVAKVNAASVPRSERILGRATCLATDAVGDCLYITAAKVGNVFQVAAADITDVTKLPVVAIVVKKDSPTNAIVQFHGPLRVVYTGLTSGLSYVVGTDSRPATVGDANYPIAGGTTHFQQIGVATSGDELLVIPLEPSLGGPGGSGGRYYQQPLTPTGDPKVFTTAISFKHGGVNDEALHYNGQRLLDGAGNDYVASESGGVGMGYDTITLEFIPRAGSNFLIDFNPDVL